MERGNVAAESGVGGANLAWALGKVVDDAEGFKEGPDRDIAFGTELLFRSLMSGLEIGDVCRLGGRDSAVDVLGQKFGVAIVGKKSAHGRMRMVPGEFGGKIEALRPTRKIG